MDIQAHHKMTSYPPLCSFSTPLPDPIDGLASSMRGKEASNNMLRVPETAPVEEGVAKELKSRGGRKDKEEPYPGRLLKDQIISAPQQ